ncbi:MAG: UV DNA damage repair endonuclease UvsE [Clostridium chrysemydis]|uniref:UV DNA damage repair endonuclease UvsE n=1 Tax=Clostridium chrysemydis TaxID=2665504 RepID=UPI003F3A2C86
MKLGLCCMLSNTRFKKGYSGINACRKRLEDTILLEATLHNIRETEKCIQWVIDNKTGMYRFSSDIIPFDTEWNWDKNPIIVSKLMQLGSMIKKHNIRATIHPSQFCVINSENKDVIKNSIQILEHHYVLCQYLNIEGIIIHTGSAKDDYKDRFITMFNKLPKVIQSKIMLENCHSVSISDVLDICNKTNIKPILDLHHNRICGKVNLDSIKDNIFKLWGSSKPIGHISSGRTSSVDKAHNDFILQDDIECFDEYFNSFDLEIEAKLKDLAILEIKKYKFLKISVDK